MSYRSFCGPGAARSNRRSNRRFSTVQWYTSALFYHPHPRGAHLEQDGTQAGQENSGTQARLGPVRFRGAQARGASGCSGGARPNCGTREARDTTQACGRRQAGLAAGSKIRHERAPGRPCPRRCEGSRPGEARRPAQGRGGGPRRRPEGEFHSARSQARQGREARRREAGDPPAAVDARGSSVAVETPDRARQGTGLPDLRRSQRSPAVRDRRSGADRRHRADDQRHGHSGVREGTGCRSTAAARAGGRRRRSRRGSRGGARHHRRRRIRPHHRSRSACTCARWARSSC